MEPRPFLSIVWFLAMITSTDPVVKLIQSSYSGTVLEKLVKYSSILYKIVKC